MNAKNRLADLGTITDGGKSETAANPRFAKARRNAHLSVDERVTRGKDARREAPRSNHGGWEPAPDRRDPVALLEEQAETRSPSLSRSDTGACWSRRSPSTAAPPPHGFRSRSDTSVSHQRAALRRRAPLELRAVRISRAEAHLRYQRLRRDAPRAWEWDVKRLAASFEILGRERGFSPGDRREIVLACVRDYRQVMLKAARMRTLEAWYDHIDVEQLMDLVHDELAEGRLAKKEARQAKKDVAKARTRDSLRIFAKRADEIDGELRIVADPPLVVPLEDLAEPDDARLEGIEEWMRSLVTRYRRSLARQHHPLEEFEYVHTARKVVGVGSVGTRAWIHLFVGRDEQDPLFLQSKEATAVGARAVSRQERARRERPRVVVGQRLMQAASDIFLGWLRVKGLDGVTRDYYVAQLHDWKGAVEADGLLVPGTTLYARLCGATLGAPTPAGAIGSRSRRTWARVTPSTGRSLASPPGMPTRTTATTSRSYVPSSRAGSAPRRACRRRTAGAPKVSSCRDPHCLRSARPSLRPLPSCRRLPPTAPTRSRLPSSTPRSSGSSRTAGAAGPASLISRSTSTPSSARRPSR